MEADGWFRGVAGMDEPEWLAAGCPIPPKLEPHVGAFRTVTLAELERTAAAVEPAGAPPPIAVRTRSSYGSPELFDTSELQYAGPERAMYQVASNFNCLEVGHEQHNPFDGSFLTQLMSDTTQGPSAAGGAGPGAMLRLAAHRKAPINLLQDTALRPSNGKLRNAKGLTLGDVSRVRVGLHEDTRAMFVRSDRRYKCDPKGPLIDQVFTSTCICGGGRYGPLPGQLLEAAYHGTYMCCVARRSPMLVLTCIGGGAFANPPTAIAAAIASAHAKWASRLAPGCKVLLPLFDPHPSPVLAKLKELGVPLEVEAV